MSTVPLPDSKKLEKLVVDYATFFHAAIVQPKNYDRHRASADETMGDIRAWAAGAQQAPLPEPKSDPVDLTVRSQVDRCAPPEPALPVAWRWSKSHSERPEDRAWKDGLPPGRAHPSRLEVAYAAGSTPWRGMDSAPRDGQEVLLRVRLRAGIRHQCLVGHFMEGGHCIEDHPAIARGWYFWNGHMFDEAAEPEAWLPLFDAVPAPEPAEQKASQADSRSNQQGEGALKSDEGDLGVTLRGGAKTTGGPRPLYFTRDIAGNYHEADPQP